MHNFLVVGRGLNINGMTTCQRMVDMADQSWLATLYREHRRSLFLTAWNVLRCPSLAEDAVHSAFSRLAELPAPPQEPKLYAFRAVRNAAIDAAKARARRREETMFTDIDRAEFEVLSRETEAMAAAATALEQLDDVSREVIELHLHARLTFQEIGLLLEQPLPTVASRYRRALERIRELLEVCHE